MTFVKLDQRFSPYQMPCVIIGSIVDGRPNFMTLTWASRVNRSPPVWMVSVNVKHYTMEGIRENKAFTINFPSIDLMQKVDYIGVTSGRQADKSKLFTIFYGDTKAPMIEECPLTMELTLTSLNELPDHFVVLGTAVNTFFDERFLSDGKPDLEKMNLIIYTGIEGNPSYWSIGEMQARAFKIGKEFKA